MGKETKTKTINVYCKNGHLLFEKYRKVGAGRLKKCYRDEIKKDYTQSEQLGIDGIIYCAQCRPALAVAVIKMIHGRVAYEIKQSGIKKVVT